MRRLLVAATAVLAVALMPPAASAAVDLIPGTPVTDGPVTSLARAGNRIYLGGSFGYVGPATGSAARLEPVEGRMDLRAPLVDGPVYAVAWAPDFGWYIGGAFTHVGGVERPRLAHIRPDGSLDPDFAPVPDGPVLALESEHDRLFAGGTFTSVSGVSRNALVALDKATGAVDPAFDAGIAGGMGTLLDRGLGSTAGTQAITFDCFDAQTWQRPALVARGVAALELAGNRLYAGGDFAQAGGFRATNLASLDPATGQPQGSVDADGPVWALADDDSNHLYVGGSFTNLAGASRSRLAALDPTTGEVDERFQIAADGPVSALTVGANRVFAGGSFTRIGGAARPGLAALGLDDGAVDSGFSPSASGSVAALGMGGGRLYVGGGSPDAALRLTALDQRSGARDTRFDAHAGDAVLAIAADDAHVFAAGQFMSVNGFTRPGLAALNTASGQVDQNFVPRAAMNVATIATSSRRLYASGVDLRTQRRTVVARDLATGALDTRFRVTRTVGTAVDLAAAGRAVYAAGLRVKGRIMGVVALDAYSGRPIRSFRPHLRGGVTDISVSRERVYAAGRIYLRRSRTGNFADLTPAVALSRRTGTRLRSFSARKVRPSGSVMSMGLTPKRLYLAGEFSGPDLVALSPVSGRRLARFQAPAAPRIGAIAPSARRLYADLGGERGLVALDLATGKPDPGFDGRVAEGRVCALLPSDSALYAGGAFGAVGSLQPYLAAFTRGGADF